ncbi:MAG TPA: esterase-like activity of phytase family protein, partial [Chromatiaceae bacterium]|nr:esterase-like activity of phytase family protein [Chromatiaceae bacterium]
GAQIIRDGDRIAAIQPGQMQRLKSSKGVTLTHRITDSEGLAIAPDGTLFISFETVIRVARYAQTNAKAKVLRKHPAFGTFAGNKALEALAIDPQGRLFTLPEQVEPDGTLQVFVLDNGVWTTPFTLPGDPDFLPVGADFGPDGRLYLLERAFGIWGFRSRVRRWDITGDTPTNQGLLFETEFGTHDNLEGLTVWRDQQGRTRLTMISDDNFLWLQTTEIVEYAVQE